MKNIAAFWGPIIGTWVNPFKLIKPETGPDRSVAREGAKTNYKHKPPLRLSAASKCVWQLDREG